MFGAEGGTWDRRGVKTCGSQPTRLISPAPRFFRLDVTFSHATVASGSRHESLILFPPIPPVSYATLHDECCDLVGLSPVAFLFSPVLPTPSVRSKLMPIETAKVMNTYRRPAM
jgi:hypothetical protein